MTATRPVGRGLRRMSAWFSAQPADFAPDLLSIQERPPARLPRTVGFVTVGLFVSLLAWGVFAKVDIIASAEGRLVPRNDSRLIQPAEAGLIREVLVRDGQEVTAGQLLMRLDATTAGADLTTLEADMAFKQLSLRRIDAELTGQPLGPMAGAPADIAAQVRAQHQSHRQGYRDALAQEQAALDRAIGEATSATRVLEKLRATVPLYRQQAQSYERLVKDGYVSQLGANEKFRERIEKEQDLMAQQATVSAAAASVEQSRKRLLQVKSGYETQLHNERVELSNQQQKVEGEMAKQNFRAGLLEVRATEAGVVKDLLSTRPGTVVQPGAVLLTLVPKAEPLLAEVAVQNEDVGFVVPGQAVRLKFQAYPFQKYGLLGGTVETVSADSSAKDPQKAVAMGQSPQSYKALVRLDDQRLVSADGGVLRLAAGMVVQAEIDQGRRTVLEYLMSPVQRVAHDAARER